MTNIGIWVEKNKLLLYQYKGKYVAITDKIIAHGEHLRQVDDMAREQEKNYVLYYVPRNIGTLTIHPIHLKSVSLTEWQPLYSIELLSLRNESFTYSALIDSGADISCIPLAVGADMGFEPHHQEVRLKAYGIGGEIDYLLRECQIRIDDHLLKIPAAWIQKDETELIIGRAVVFDNFHITFKQRERNIEFCWVGDTGN